MLRKIFKMGKYEVKFINKIQKKRQDNVEKIIGNWEGFRISS